MGFHCGRRHGSARKCPRSLDIGHCLLRLALALRYTLCKDRHSIITSPVRFTCTSALLPSPCYPHARSPARLDSCLRTLLCLDNPRMSNSVRKAFHPVIPAKFCAGLSVDARPWRDTIPPTCVSDDAEGPTSRDARHQGLTLVHAMQFTQAVARDLRRVQRRHDGRSHCVIVSKLRL